AGRPGIRDAPCGAIEAAHLRLCEPLRSGATRGAQSGAAGRVVRCTGATRWSRRSCRSFARKSRSPHERSDMRGYELLPRQRPISSSVAPAAPCKQQGKIQAGAQITPYLRAFFEPSAANNRTITGQEQEKGGASVIFARASRNAR